jgi:hypothetical protein
VQSLSEECVVPSQKLDKNLIMYAIVPKVLCPIEIDYHPALKAFPALRTLEIKSK